MKKAFRNPHQNDVKRNFWHFLLWRFGFYDEKILKKPEKTFAFPTSISNCDTSKPSVVWINHSTFLISLNGHHFLTDPIWSECASPVSFFGPKRKHPPGIAFEDLPNIDFVLISHDHYDHLDRETVWRLVRRYPHILWIVPRGVKKWFTKQKIFKVVELEWWEEKGLSHTLKVTSVPAQHFSGRKGFDLNSTLWSGWIIEDKELDKKFYFVGDTGYNPVDFKKIGEKWGRMDLSLIPIGSYLPRKFMSPVHIDPQDAVRIHQEVNSHFSIGMHWKTFHLSDEPMNQPPFDLFVTLQERQLDPSTFQAVEPGVWLNW